MKKVRYLPEKFIYTNVSLDRGRIHAIGYDLETNSKVHYSSNTLPDLAYYTEDYTNSNSPYKTYVSGRPLKRYECKTISDYRKAVNDDIDGLTVHGNFNIITQWINQSCGPRIKTNSDEYIVKAVNLINIGYVDIEVVIGRRFPKPEVAEYAVTAITLYCTKSKIFYVFTDKDVSSKGMKSIEKLLVKEKKGKFALHEDATIEMRSYGGDEEQMLVDFCKVLTEIEEVDVLTGWNSALFDVPYLYFRIKRLFGEFGPNMLSPLGSVRDYFSNKKNQHVITINGIELIDSMVWYKRFTGVIKTLPSYSLDYVTNLELGAGKVKLPTTLKDAYDNYYDEYIYYNLVDVVRLVQLMEMKQLFITTFIIAYKYYSCLFKDVQSPVIGWESMLYRSTYAECKIFDHKPKDASRGGYPGAYVHIPRAGFYRDIVSGDVNSMYPHIHIGWFISPETLIKDDKFILEHFNNHPEVEKLIKLRNNAPSHLDNDAQAEWWDENVLLPMIRKEFDLSFLENEEQICMAPSLEFFWKDDKAVMPTLFDSIYSDRKGLKDEINALRKKASKLKNTDPTASNDLQFRSGLKQIEQMALKIVLNAGYGAVGSPSFYFHENRISRTVTLTGRFIIQSSAHIISSNLKQFLKDEFGYTTTINPWVYSDTDAVDITFEDLVKCMNGMRNMPLTPDERVDLLDKFWETYVQDWLNKHFSDIAVSFNSKDVIVMKREVIALAGIWRDLRKHYILLVADDEGIRYKEPIINMKGSQFVSASIPEKCKVEYDKILHMMVKADDPKSPAIRKEVMKIIDDFREVFAGLPIDEISESIGTNKIEEYIDKNGIPKKGAPFNVKAANTYNQYLASTGLIRQGYSPIQSGTKIKVVPLKKGNPYNNMMFGFEHELPEGFDVRYIDYESMFHKNFLKYIEAFSKELNLDWNLAESGTPVPDDAF